MNDLESIKRVLETDYPKYINSSDAAGYASLYTDDTLWSPPGGPDQLTSPGIKMAATGMFDQVSIEVSIAADEVDVYGTSASVIGVANGTTTNCETKEVNPFKYRVVWLMSDVGGTWKIKRQVWNNKPTST